MPDYDAIVVGGGPAGSAAAYCMARDGLNVLMLERGDAMGSKNVSGGRLYAHSLERIIPGFAATAPVERQVVRETVSLLTEESSVSLDFTSSRLAGDAAAASYTVLRAEFDAWLARQAEEAGCDVVNPARVDDLLRDGTEVVGVVAGEDEITAEAVVLADGVNSLLAQKAGLKKELSPRQVAVGAKEIIELPREAINDRFGLADGEGQARLFAGVPSRGLVGGGFLYTNRESISLGIVMGVSELCRATERVPDMLESFKAHPALRPLLAGGRTVEYSAHLVPEAGLGMLPELVGDRVLVAGDAAGLCLNLGYTVRGMDLAIASGEMAAQAVVEAKARGDFSRRGLAGYATRLAESFVLKDLKTYSKAPDFIEHTARLYTTYPALAEGILLDLFRVTNTPAARAFRRVLPHLKRTGLLNLARDGWKGMGAI